MLRELLAVPVVRWALVGMLLLMAGTVLAANTALISFSAPTKYTDGTSIAAGTAISYNVYQGAKGATKTKVGTITSTSTTISVGLVGGAEYCWQVTAVVNGVESALSNEGCKSFPFPTPETVTITVT